MKVSKFETFLLKIWELFIPIIDILNVKFITQSMTRE